MNKNFIGLSAAAALLGLLVATGDGQTASAQSVEPAPAPHVFPTRDRSVKTLSALKHKLSGPIMFTTPGTTPNGITYNGGPVMLSTVHIYLIWYGNWAGNSATTILPDLAAHIGGSPYFNINTTYDDSSSNHVSGAVTFAGSTTDSYSHGTSITDADVQAIVSSALSGGSLPTDTNGVYFVVTSSDVNETTGFCSTYCGWHTHASLFGSDIKYSFVGDSAQCPTICAAQQASSPNGNIGADGMASVLAHELEESVTDPDLNAWHNGSFNENADMCAWTFGTQYTVANGSHANMHLGSRDYLIQQNWMNAHGGGCVLSLPDQATMTVGHSSVYFGYSNGTAYGTFGSLSPSTLSSGNTVKLFVDVVNPFGLGSASVAIAGFSANPGSTWLTTAAANGVTLSGSAASYSYSAGTASWTWTASSTTTPFGLWAISGGTTTTTLTHL